MIIKNNQELKKLKEDIAAEREVKQKMKNDLMIIKTMLPDLFPPTEKEEKDKVIEPDEKEVEPKEKKSGFFTNLEENKENIVRNGNLQVASINTVQQKDVSRYQYPMS